MEIALKVAAKIRANERFAVYIVIPMWPEGVPTGAATQRILFWQVCFNSQHKGHYFLSDNKCFKESSISYLFNRNDKVYQKYSFQLPSILAFPL